ncbi:MAG: DNA-binding response regulator, partial [Acidobacteria bacterium]
MDSQPANTTAKKLLIADDEFELRTLLSAYFRRLGFEVTEKDNGLAALQTATTERFDCFILDVSMPEMSGVELLKKLRERGVQTPAIFLTAHVHLEDKVAGFEAGADDYLSKPFEPQELEYRITALLRRGQLAPTATDDDR